jgi:hypothetical protein
MHASMDDKVGDKHPNSDALPCYHGPIGSFDDIECGLSIEDIGLDVMIGPSSIPAAGKGLFVALSEDIDEASLERGTAICGYSRGAFYDESIGTKAVAFAFDSLHRGIFFNKKLVSLYDVIMKELPSLDDEHRPNDISDVIEGHVVLYNNNTQDVVIYPDEDYKGGRYFIPDEDHVWSAGYFGMYANDLAYDPNITEDDYQTQSQQKNILRIVWRMDYNQTKKQLVPVWPIVILDRDIVFRNTEPMEIGLSYTWKYWEAARLLAAAEE